MTSGMLSDHGHISADQWRIIAVRDAAKSKQQTGHAETIAGAELQFEQLRHPARKAFVTKNCKAGDKPEDGAGDTADVNRVVLD